MTEPSIFFSEVNERQGVFTRRTFLMGGIAGVGLGALAGRLAQLQLVQNSEYRKLADKNQFNYRLIVPARGLITDRNGVALASSRANFRVLVSRDSIKNLDETLDALGEIIPITDDKKKSLEREFKNGPRFAPISIAEDLSWEQFSAINVRAPELPGVTAEMGEARVYPFAGAFAHVLGYVTKPNAADIKAQGPEPDRLVTHPAFRIGKTGIEKAFDKDLRGVAGGQKLEVDVRGRVVRADPKGDKTPEQGKTVVLSIDADVQNRALEVFGDESGAAVVMDVRTGDVLCLASCPSFDVNQFARGISQADYSALANYERTPLLNKAIQGNYPPGSTFKTMVALAALEDGVPPNKTYSCGGAWQFGNHVFHCDKSHGTLNLHDAVKTSCDIYFYQTAVALGPDKIATVAKKFGLGQTFDIGIPERQRAGVVGDTAWKRKRFPKDPVWHPGDTPSIGIGQGYMDVNPLQSCVMVSRLANGDKAINPRLIRSVGGVETLSGLAAPELTVNKEHLAFVRAAMASVANDAGGTGYAASQLGLGDIKMAGKTGTAQAFTYGAGSRATAHLDWARRDHAWYVAFAPYDDPRYAISVIVEHGGWGASAAAPKAREIMRVALLKDPEMRKRIESGAGMVTPLPALPANPDDEGAAPEAPTPIAVVPTGTGKFGGRA
jgi:penicillin-binding protein 2